MKVKDVMAKAMQYSSRVAEAAMQWAEAVESGQSQDAISMYQLRLNRAAIDLYGLPEEEV